MTLLTPLNLLLATVAFLPPLVLLYLLKRRRSVRRVPSVMFWPQAGEDLEANAPWRRFRFSWLLVVQAGVLLLLALAISRPVIDADRNTAQLILLVDVGASMGSRIADSDGPGDSATRLDLAKTRAGAIARQWLDASPGGELQIVAFAREATLVGGAFSDPRRVQAVLDSLAAREEPSRLAPAIELASALSRRGESGGRVGVVLLSDGVLERSAQSLPAETFAFEAIEAASAGNAGVVALTAARDPDEPTRIEVLARIASTMPSGHALPVTLRIDGETIATRMVELTASPADPADRSSLSEGSVEFRFPHEGAGLIEIRLPSDDSLAADDAAFASMDAAVPLRIAMVAAGGVPDPFLVEGLAAVQAGTIELLDPEEWRSQLDRLDPPADLLVLDGVASDTPLPIPSLSFSASPGWIATASGDAPADGPALAQSVIRWDRRADLLRDLDLLDVAAARSLLLEAHPLARTIIEGSRGPLLVEREVDGTRHALVAFRPADSTWPVDPGFVAFLANARDRLARGGVGGAARIVRTGEPLEVRCGRSADGIRVAGPDGELVAAAACSDGRIVTLAPLSRTGVHRLEGATWPGSGSNADAPSLAVGASLLDARESDNRPRRDLQLAMEAPAIASARLPSALWPLLAAAALVFVIGEWLLYLRASRPPR